MKVQYPECEKMVSVQDKSQVIGEFLAWLKWEKNWEICKRSDSHDNLSLVGFSIERLLAEFFGIDLVQVEKEKCQMLDEIRRKDVS